MRIGIGFDVHSFKENSDLILGGVKIDYHKGLEGHSDADVLVHAIMDAMLGSMGKRDIGVYFPDTDNSFKDISSMMLLKKVHIMMKDEGYEILNIDSILILEKPKVSVYIDEMIINISNALDIDNNMVAVKATTTEGLGFSGRGEGVAAKAVVLIKKV